MDLQQQAASLSESCRSCEHSLGTNRSPCTYRWHSLVQEHTASHWRIQMYTFDCRWLQVSWQCMQSYDFKLVSLSADHVSHLENVSEDEINRLLGMVVDVENLFMSVHKEEDTDTKQVYFYLFKVSKCVCIYIFFYPKCKCHLKASSFLLLTCFK